MNPDYIIGQGDTDNIQIQLTDANGKVDLSNATVKCQLKGDAKTYTITCNILEPETDGKIEVPITDTESKYSGTYALKIFVLIGGYQTTFPTSENDKILYIKET